MDKVRISLREAIASLTPYQKRVYDYISKYAVKNGDLPTMRQAGYELNLPVSSVYYHIQTLIRKGVFNYGQGRRSYRVSGAKTTIDYDTIVASEVITDGRRRKKD